MKKTTVYDLPLRFFHWLFALLFITAFIIANTADDDSSLFSYHMLAGLSLLFMLVLRLIWGFIGSTYARFSSFRLNTSELLGYFRDSFMGNVKRYLSHNPASSYAAILMFVFTAGLGVTGILMATGNSSEFHEEAHEVMANLFLATVVLHILGLIIHHFRHKDALWSSMLDGKKKAIAKEEGISSAQPIAGIIFLLLTLSWMGYLNAQYNRQSQSLDLFGNRLELSEHENEGDTNGINEYNHEREDGDEHEDDD